MRFRFSLLADYMVPSAFIPLSLLTFHVQVSAYSTKKQCRTIRHIAASFPSHLLAASDSSPIRVRILQQVRGSCSYVLCPHRQFRSFACSQFYSLVLRLGTSACFFSLACLSFMVAGTPEHQCSLFVFVLVCSRRDAAAHQRVRTAQEKQCL